METPTLTPSLDEILNYEDGSMDRDETVSFFSRLIKSGMVNHLQGSYGRTAARLIEAGYLAPNGDILDRED
jgi:hypothetical protein